MKIDRRIRDTVHGFVALTAEESALLDTPALQRLRRVRQLAMASLVYPGAVHTRFDHTLGVLHIANMMCDRLQIEERYSPTIRLAALLHDVGHGPFSHVSESVLKIVARTNLAKLAKQQDKIHELITRDIILTHQGFDKTLTKGERQNITDLLNDGLKDSVHKAIISGPVDADKQDYLLRDSHYCGVQYGRFDIAHLHNVLTPVEDVDQKVLMVEPSGIHVIEQFVLAKYYLTTQVYRHKVRLITDQMLTRALVLGVVKDHLPFLEKLYVYKSTPDYIENYLTWDDSRLTQELLKEEYSKTNAGQFFRRLVHRQLYKRVCQVSLNDISGNAQIASAEEFLKKRGEMEKGMAVWLKEKMGIKLSADHVIVHHYSIESARKQSRNSERSIPIHTLPSPTIFEDASSLFHSIDEKGKEEFVECYAPLDGLSRIVRSDMENNAKKFLVQLLADIFPNNHQKSKNGGKSS
ncbi:MAG: HD domain-containing protein [Verrucomicrobiota bacterium]